MPNENNTKMYKHIEHFRPDKVVVIYVIAALFGFSSSLTAYVASSYFEAAWNTNNVSLFFLIPNALQLVSIFFLHTSLRRGGKSWTLLIFLLAQFLTLAGAMGMGVSKSGAFFLMAYLFVITMVYAALDILLETFSEDGRSGRIRGVYLTCANLGFLFGPFASTRIVHAFGYHGLFAAILVIAAIIILIASAFLRSEGRTRGVRISPKGLLKIALQQGGDVRHIYFLAMTLEIFYAVMTIYMPLYLLQTQQMDLKQMGIVFSIMLLPFVLFQYPAGRLADRFFGEKEFIMLALAIMAVFSAATLYTGVFGVAWWAFVLFGTRVGAALLEVMRDSYFYKKVDGENVEVISLFHTARPIGIIFASFASFIILLFASIQGVFVFMLCCILAAFYPALRLKDNASEKDLARR